MNTSLTIQVHYALLCGKKHLLIVDVFKPSYQNQMSVCKSDRIWWKFTVQKYLVAHLFVSSHKILLTIICQTKGRNLRCIYVWILLLFAEKRIPLDITLEYLNNFYLSFKKTHHGAINGDKFLSSIVLSGLIIAWENIEPLSPIIALVFDQTLDHTWYWSQSLSPPCQFLV